MPSMDLGQATLTISLAKSKPSPLVGLKQDVSFLSTSQFSLYGFLLITLTRLRTEVVSCDTLIYCKLS